MIGIIVSNFPEAEYGPLHYMVLQHDKTKAFSINAGNFNKPMRLSSASLKELQWWIEYVPHVSKRILYPVPSMIIQSDAAKKGWGAVYNGDKIGGRWLSSEALQHINTLKLQAAMFGSKSFAEHKKGRQIQLQLDNTTAVACINNTPKN